MGTKKSFFNKVCTNCGEINWSTWQSSTTGKIHKYCKTCRRKRAHTYSNRKKAAAGSHTKREWLELLAKFKKCPGCNKRWSRIPKRPDRRYKYVWTKDHILPLGKDGTDFITNIQPLCYKCNFGKRVSDIKK